MRDLELLALMARTAREAAALMPANIAPGQFDTWPSFKAAFDAVDAPAAAFARETLERAYPGVPVVEEIDSAVSTACESPRRSRPTSRWHSRGPASRRSPAASRPLWPPQGRQ